MILPALWARLAALLQIFFRKQMVQLSPNRVQIEKTWKALDKLSHI